MLNTLKKRKSISLPQFLFWLSIQQSMLIKMDYRNQKSKSKDVKRQQLQIKAFFEFSHMDPKQTLDQRRKRANTKTISNYKKKVIQAISLTSDGKCFKDFESKTITVGLYRKQREKNLRSGKLPVCGEQIINSYQSKRFIIQYYYLDKEMSKRQTKKNEEDGDYDPNDPSNPKRNYRRVNKKKASHLCDMAIKQGVPVSRACKKLRIEPSNAKVIVRKEKRNLKQAKIEAQSTVKVEQDVNMEFVEAESGAKLNENIPEMMEFIPYEIPVFYWPIQVSEYPFSVVMVPFHL